MQKGINYAAQELKETLVKVVNESGVPITLVHYVLTELLQQATELAGQQVQREKAEFVKAKADEKAQADESEVGE